MKAQAPRYPFRVRWWENDISYAGVRDEGGWHFHEKEAGTVHWFEIASTPYLIGRAEASLAAGAHVQELPSRDSDPPFPEIQFYSCFISYATKDQEFADRLHTDLEVRGVRCWFAPHDIAAGKKLHEQIDEAIRLHDRLLLILSPASMSSKWVKTEIAKARKREEKDHQRVLFPVRLVDFEALRNWECFDTDLGIDSASEVREYFIPDFSRWKEHNFYKQAFERLLFDLKAEAQKT